MNKKQALLAGVAACLMTAALSQNVWAAWKVDNPASDFHFVTTKAGAAGTIAITEVHRFREISGEVDDAGRISFNVATASVDTAIPLRNDRLRQMLFNSGVFPTAGFSGQVDMGEIGKLAVGDTMDVDVPGMLTIVGAVKPVTAKLRIVRLSGNRLLASTRESLIVNANDYGLQSGVEALRSIMHLNVLSPSAPVDFSVVLTQG